MVCEVLHVFCSLVLNYDYHILDGIGTRLLSIKKLIARLVVHLHLVEKVHSKSRMCCIMCEFELWVGRLAEKAR